MDIQNGSEMGQVSVVMVPFPAQGHLNQLLHFSHLITSYGIPVHYAGSATHNRQAKLRVQGWDAERLAKVHFHDFQLPSYTSPEPNPDSNMLFPAHLQPLFDASVHLREPVSELLSELSRKCRRVIVVHDSFVASVVQDVKFIPNAECFHFIPISAFTRFLGFWERIAQDEEPFQVDSGVIPKYTPSREGIITPELEQFVGDQRKFWGFESGRIYNTSRAIEGTYVDLLEKLSEDDGETKHFVLGPFHPVKIIRERKQHICLEWLDEQEKGSVIYVSFGSTTSMTDDQIRELATGLERTGQKFIWVLRNADKGDTSNVNGEDRKPRLPKGYEESVMHRGMVVREWAPQLDILAHPSVAGFMSHCGWNSCIESFSMGVPIAAWPMHSDQPRNTVLITEVLRVGVTVRVWEDHRKLVTSDIIESAVKRLMASEEGEEMRQRASKLSDDIRKSVSKGGTSHSEMNAFITHITRQSTLTGS